MRIKLTGVFVTDQDKALAFYTEKLGFQLKTDAPYGPGERWLTVVSPEDAGGTELLLSLAKDASQAFQKANFDAGMPATSFVTDDVQAEYERLEAKGVKFTLEPTKMEYGGTDAVLDDECGNLINLHQD